MNAPQNHQGHIAPISGIASYGGERVVTAGYDSQLLVWDANFGLLASASHKHLVNQAEFSPCGKFIASASSDYTIGIWHADDLSELAKITYHDDDVEMVRFSPCGTMLASCSRDNSVAVFDLATYAILHEFKEHTADVLAIDWLEDSKTLVSSGDDSSLRYWDVKVGKQIAVVSFDGFETDTLVVLSKTEVLAGDDDGKITLLRNGEKQRGIQAHKSGVKRLAYNKQSRQVVSISYDRKMALWKFVDGELSRIVEADIPSWVWPRCCTFLDSETIAFCTFSNSYALYHLAEGTWDDSQKSWSRSLNNLCQHHDNSIYSVGDAGCLFRDGEPVARVDSLCNFVIGLRDKIYFGGQEGIVWTFDPALEQTDVFYRGVAPLNCAVSFTDNTLIVGDYNGNIIRSRVDVDSEHEIVPLFKHAVKGITLNGSVLFCVSADCKASEYDLLKNRSSEWGDVHSKIANGCASTPHACFSVSRDKIIRQFINGSVIEHRTPHRYSIKCVATSADGQFIATGDYAGYCTVFRIADEALVIQTTIRLSDWGISAMIFDEGRNEFACTSYDGNIYRVDAPLVTTREVA